MIQHSAGSGRPCCPYDLLLCRKENLNGYRSIMQVRTKTCVARHPR